MAQRFSFSGWYKNWFFRSLKELSFALLTEKNGSTWRTAETAEFTVEYVDPYGKTKKHYPDFFVDNKFVVEVKPRAHQKGKIVVAKAESMKKFCLAHGYIYQMISPRKIDKKELQTLIDAKQVIFTDDCKDKIDGYLKSSWKRRKKSNAKH